jgi:hypothetical protein
LVSIRFDLVFARRAADQRPPRVLDDPLNRAGLAQERYEGRRTRLTATPRIRRSSVHGCSTNEMRLATGGAAYLAVESSAQKDALQWMQAAVLAWLFRGAWSRLSVTDYREEYAGCSIGRHSSGDDLM